MTPHAFSISLSMQDLHSTLLHKYGSIRTPLHPLRLRSAPCDVLSEYASVARLAGAAPRRSRCLTVFMKPGTGRIRNILFKDAL